MVDALARPMGLPLMRCNQAEEKWNGTGIRRARSSGLTHQCSRPNPASLSSNNNTRPRRRKTPSVQTDGLNPLYPILRLPCARLRLVSRHLSHPPPPHTPPPRPHGPPFILCVSPFPPPPPPPPPTTNKHITTLCRDRPHRPVHIQI